ncbi:cytochrome b/b6 domain-containing protein [Noviherbaspirillum sp. 1P10PC]|uniref:cytochrome b/b6 domain-containing protein n=1 Tax=Noviherbaspirillum sp. 1P10PC TaxID=3132292 RepID=UPI00399F9EEA
MNDQSAPAGPIEGSASADARVLVWDLPVRLFHWLTVFCFAGAYLTAESDDWRLLHVTLGYTMGGLVLFRILWGFVGTRYARFSDFVHGPAQVRAYLRALVRRQPGRHYIGHNPAGALAIVALMALALAVTASGWALYHEMGGKALEEVHEAAANIMLALVGLHVAAVLLSSRLHHENLVAAMFSGYKSGRPGDAIRYAWRSVAALMLVAVLGFWWWQWHSATAAHGGPPVSMLQAIRR